MGLEMLSSSPPASVEPGRPAAAGPAGGTNAASPDAFSAAVGRLLDDHDDAVQPKADTAGAGLQVDTEPLPTTAAGDEDANALLLSVATSQWFVAPLPQAEPPRPAGMAPVEGLAAAADVADGTVPTAIDILAAGLTPGLATPVNGDITVASPDSSGEANAPDTPSPADIAAAPATAGSRLERQAGSAAHGALPQELPAGLPAGLEAAVEQARRPQDDEPVPAASPSTSQATPRGEEPRIAIAGDAGVARTSEPKPARLSPQGARLAAALAHGDRTAVASITTAAMSVETGRVAVPSARGEQTAAHAAIASRSIEMALPEQAAPGAARESATRFSSFDTSVAALAAEAFQVRSPGEAGLDSSSGWARARGAYDLRSAGATTTTPDLLDGRPPVVFDPRIAAGSTPAAPADAVVPTGSLPDGAHAAAGDVPTQIVRAMHLQWRGGVSEAKLTLTPESLGEVTIAMKIDRGVVTATVKADNPVTMEWIRSHHQELRDALTARGLTLAEFDVSVDPDDRRKREQAADQQAAHGPRQPVRGDAPRFELLL